MIVYYFLGSTVVLLLVIAIVTYAFLHQKKVVQLKMQLHEEELRRQQAVFDALQEGQEQERTRLAQELHDGIGAKLSGLKMNLEYLDINATEYKELISMVFRGLSQTLEEVREVSHNLMPLQLDEKDIKELLQDYIEQFNAFDSCTYELYMPDALTGLDAQTKIHVCRMITELLNNIHKHAAATIASVQITAEAGKMAIVVEDNGIGMGQAVANASGIGLKNISNRVNVCKGVLNLDASEKGTTVIIELPLNINQ